MLIQDQRNKQYEFEEKLLQSNKHDLDDDLPAPYDHNKVKKSKCEWAYIIAGVQEYELTFVVIMTNLLWEKQFDYTSLKLK